MLPIDIGFAAGEDVSLPVSVFPRQNVTGFSLKFSASGMKGQASLVKDNGDVGGVTVEDAATGACLIAFTSADTASLAPDTYSWSLRRVDAGHDTVLACGMLYVVPSP